MPEAVRRWYQKIGAMGGQAGKGTETRRELMRRNAHIRWNKYRKTLAKEMQTKIKKLVPKEKPAAKIQTGQVPSIQGQPVIGFK
jgi:hypothetical protein